VANIEAPVLVFGGATDGIAPIPSVRAVIDLLTGAAEARFEIVPGGHLGMLTGRAARGTTWRVLDEWIDQWSSDAAGEPTPEARARRTGVAVVKGGPAKKATKKAPRKTTKAAAGTKATAPRATKATKKAAGTAATKKSAASKTTATKKTATKKSAAATTATKTTPTKNTGTSKTATKKAGTSARKAPARRRTKASRESIGANPSRRYPSDGSRSLSR
jgi:polyhydroxyalkanoate synthase